MQDKSDDDQDRDSSKSLNGFENEKLEEKAAMANDLTTQELSKN